MCLAIPARIVEIDKYDEAIVAVEGIRKRISTALLDDVAIDEYVLVHVGFALHRVSAAEAEATLKLMADAGMLSEELESLGESAAPTP